MKIDKSYAMQHMQSYHHQMHKQSTTGKNGAQADQVNISEEAKAMQAQQADDLERQAKVDQLKTAVQDGTYRVDATKTAQAFLDYWLNR